MCCIQASFVHIARLLILLLAPGPDGVKDHQTRVKDPQWVGHGTASPESTANLNYLCRAPKVREQKIS